MMIQIDSQKRDQFIDITRQIQQAVNEHGLVNGAIIIFVRHTTAALTINENADPDVVQDILCVLDKNIPWQDNYQHIEGNSAAHLKSSLLGASETIIVRNTELQLGTWQGIYLCEFDGPRRRQVELQFIATA